MRRISVNVCSNFSATTGRANMKLGTTDLYSKVSAIRAFDKSS